ncbi:hypothetical protein QJS66_10930 [Kocuria rhizophila]|nr:hypothetical protein QJS66_10930 [Kocuria rhizophila]
MKRTSSTPAAAQWARAGEGVPANGWYTNPRLHRSPGELDAFVGAVDQLTA